ncbi:MAG: glycosyltransferase family 39 protein [Dehalococcoidia bacterium]|nr:glycosyltransferase family 39 protein [Dehalococcoidia bacterium]
MALTDQKGASAPVGRCAFRLWELASRYRVAVVLVALMLTGLALRLWGIDRTDVVYGDEIPNVRIAMGFAATRSIVPVGGSIHPAGYPDVLLLTYGLYAVVGLVTGAFASLEDMAFTYLVDPHAFYVIARAISAVGGAAAIALTFRLGRRLADDRTGLVAAGIMTVAYLPVWFSHFALMESMVMLLATGAFLASLHALTSPTRRAFVLAGALGGFAMSTKYNGGFFILPMVAAHVLASRRAGMTWRQTLLGANLWLGLGVAVAAFLLLSPFWIVQFPERVASALSYFQIRSSGAWTGQTSSDIAALSLLQSFLEQEWAIGVVLLAGVVGALFRRKSEDILALAAILPLFLFVGALRSSALHYILPAYPLLVALGAVLLVRILPRPAWLAGSVAALLIIPTAGHVIADRIQGSAPDARVAAARWIEGNVPRGEKVALAFFWAGSCNPPILANGPEIWTLAKSDVDSGFMARLPASFPKRLDAYFAARPVYRVAFLEEFASPEEMRAAGVRYAAVSSCAYAPYVDQPPPPAGASWAEQYLKTHALYSTLLAPTPGVRTLAAFTPEQGYGGPEVRVLELSPGAGGR